MLRAGVLPVEVVSDAIVLPAGLALKGWRLLKASSFWSAPHLLPYWRRYALYKLLTMRAARERIPEAILIHHPWANNYAHWFADCIPRLLAVEGYQRYPVLLPEDYQRFAQESLIALGVKQIIPLKKIYLYRVERLILPHMPAFDSIANSYEQIEGMRALFWSRWASEGNAKRIYLSRAQATRRKVLNESELFPILQKHGFEVITTENWSLEAQVRLFSQVRLFLSMHGAGLMNLLWMRRGGTVIEILSEHHIQDTPPMHTYANHARLFGLQHFYFIAPTAPHSVKDIFDRADVVIDPAPLDAFLETLIKANAQ